MRRARDELVDHLDDDDSSGGPARAPVTVATVALRWPVLAVCGLSAAGLVVALLASPVVFGYPLASVIAWVVLMVGGCGLLFFRRYDAIRATRSAGGVGTAGVQTIEKVAIGVLVAACLANGIVIALDVASWQVWGELWGGDE